MDTNILPLEKGNLIALVAPGKAIEKELILQAKAFFEKQGYIVQIGKNCTGQFNYFSGTDEERTADFQEAIDNHKVKAIICVRGGYGSIRILDRLNWAAMLRYPKWIVGFSDVTVFHQRMQKFDMKSIHATMPLNFSQNSPEALSSMLEALRGIQQPIQIPNNPNNKTGKASGRLIGGNLSILYSLLGTNDQPDYTDSILFVEDLSEQLYHIDRMFYAFAKSGILNKIRGLIIGGMTDLKDTAIPFGQDVEAIILAHLKYRKIPVVFNFPAGHIDDNRALIFGTEVELEVTSDEVNLRTFVI
jgi:muramoyltetrapeptide carboxypeptidase